MIVAFSGPKGAGKSTAMEALHPLPSHTANIPGEWVHLAFAESLKRMLAALIGWEAINDRELREKPHPLLGGKTPRYALQTLGTQWGRELISVDVWVHVWRERAREVIKAGSHVVTDDLRFANEEEAVRDMGGCIIEVHRSGVHRDKSHESEAYTPDYHYLAINNKTPEGLAQRVRELVDLYSDRLNAEDW